MVGSRNLFGDKLDSFTGLFKNLLERGSVHVGCCVGVDEFFLRAALENDAAIEAVRCFAAFGASNEGACSLSATDAVEAFGKKGGKVEFWAGGDGKVPLRARLTRRTSAVISGAKNCIAFLSGQQRGGSLKACEKAAKKGMRVIAFVLSKKVDQPVPIGKGSWSKLKTGCYVWVPR